MTKLRSLFAVGATAAFVACGATATEVKVTGNGPAAYEEDGRYFTEDGAPIYHISEDGTVDWLTYSGYRRYHSECHVCHGPDGMGSTYAPPLKDAVEAMAYSDFVYTVSNGRENVSSAQKNVMPSFGHNKNVMCYLDDIYVYLKARGDGAIPRGRPPKKEAKTDAIAEDVNACMG